MKSGFWRGRRVLVTGYEGFLGSHLTKTLIGLGAVVTGLDIRTRRKETVLQKAELLRMRVIKGSVVDLDLLRRILKKERIGYVFHLAATALVEEALDGPLETFATNIEGTWNILQTCREAALVKGLIVASSDKAYGIHNKLPYREDGALCGSHPYDASKSCADLLAQTYQRTYGLAVCITRCGNIYGPGDYNFSRIFPDAARCAASGKTLYIRSNGRFTRDYIYVSDIVDGYLMLAEKMERLQLAGEAFNFSNENPLSVLKLVKLIYAAAGTRPAFKVLDRAKFEIPHQYLDSSKARRILGWRPKVSLDRGLKLTVDWYKELFAKR
jgi:CDP-glucose 4,6-dehydratase